MKRLRAIDLCGGAGGWAVAARGLPIDVVCAVDRWPAACLTYAHNHPSTHVVRADCRQIPIEPGGFDLVLGGIPCQQKTRLRSVGLGNPVREAEIEQLRELVDAILAWVDACDPRFWCLEDIAEILEELNPVWRDGFLPHHKINAEYWSGQRRRRVYVGSFPAPAPPVDGDPRTADAYLRPGPHRVHPANLKRIVSTHNTWQKRMSVYPVLFERKFPTVTTVGSRHDSKCVVLHKRRGMTVAPQHKFPTATQQHRHDKVLDETGSYRRQLEWQEAALAQGFPEDYVFVGNQTDASQMVANAVQIDLARAILREIAKAHQEGGHMQKKAKWKTKTK